MTNTVLLVEDNSTLRESIAFELEMRDYDVLQAEDGNAALRVLSSSERLPDIIVSDIAMPDMDGYALLEHTRNNSHWQNIPFIFLTAFGSKNAVRIGHDLGVDDYLVKPFEPDMLVATMESKIKRFQQLRQNTMEEVEGMRREFLRMISHELRTPLTSIYGSSEMLTKLLPKVSDEVTEQLVELLRSGTARMRRLIERLVSLVQIESGKLREQYEGSTAVVDLNDVVRNALKSYITPDFAKTVNFTAHPDSATIKGIAPFLELAIFELIHNADRYGYDEAQISIEIGRVGNLVALTVRDTGFGIKPDLLAQLQQDLVLQGSSYLNGKGMGVGLVLVRDITRIHAGTLVLESEVNTGTTITLTFPLAS
ncbi:MAG: hybrid sensor histidine kinase/response regulator [Aggregatilineales bacterium]